MAEHDASVVKKEVAGVPIWIWGGGVAAAVLLFAYLKRASANSGQVQAVSGVDSTPLDSSLNSFTQGSTGTNASPASVATNSTWLASAESLLQQQGYDPLTILSALNHFINGDVITPGSTDAKIVSAAISGNGLPPDLNSGVNVGTTAPVTSGLNLLDPSTYDFGVKAQTGDIQQDNALASSAFLQGLYDQYQAALKSGNGQSAASTQAAYLNGFQQIIKDNPENVTVPASTNALAN